MSGENAWRQERLRMLANALTAGQLEMLAELIEEAADEWVTYGARRRLECLAAEFRALKPVTDPAACEQTPPPGATDPAREAEPQSIR